MEIAPRQSVTVYRQRTDIIAWGRRLAIVGYHGHHASSFMPAVTPYATY